MNKTKHFHTYIIVLFCVCICVCMLLDNIIDFLFGFYAGWLDKGRELSHYLAEHVEWLDTLAVVAVVIIFCCLFYLQTKKKVAKPIEGLAAGMQEVSQGNLKARVLEDGEFEFVQMQRTFNGMVEELDKARQSREMQEKRNQQLYAGIAHDLKTPMTMILGYARVLEGSEDIAPEDKKRYLKTIIKQTEQANSLLDSLLAYAKLENQEYSLKKEEKDLAECLRTCVADYYNTLEEAKIPVTLEIPEAPVIFAFDEVEIKRVFHNLLVNLVKHNPVGTACVIYLEAGGSDEGIQKIRVAIADNGPQISEALQERLFESFVVGDCSRNTKNGSGLGLAISKKIVERHGGMIQYSNNWREGYKAFVVEFTVMKNKKAYL